MKTESFIKKIQPDPDGLDFEELRKEGIRLVQEICGDIWTDYNLHDPGVTILEQLCYGLTDLAYRAGFQVTDYLASSDGEIDFGRLALYRPDEIFSCRPVTDNDYRKLILDSVPYVDNVWIQRHTANTKGVDGLYHIHLLLSERVKNQDNEGVRKAYADIVRKVYAASRNLCEDLAEVKIVERIPYSVSGEIEVYGRRSPASILAEIYFECAQYLSLKIAIHSYAEMYRNGRSFEELFTGVRTSGYIADEELHQWRGDFSIQEMTGKINRIDGVKDIKHLAFTDGEGNEEGYINLGDEHALLSVACLQFPPTNGEAGIKLYKNGKSFHISLHDVETEFNRLNYRHQARRNREQEFDDWVVATLPKANFRNVREYYSIQNHFPDVYGVNFSGVPDSETPERKAQAMQLKAYLLFFEQVMANFLQNMQEIPRLFSLDDHLGQSYFHQVLKNDAVPNIENIYQYDVTQMEIKLAGVVAEFDNYGDRRNRVLDYLLGLYGEKFSQNSLRHFDGGDVDSDNAKIRNKIAFLKETIDAGKDRAAAFNYYKIAEGDDNSAGLKKKLATLLGLRPVDGDWHIVEHILLRPSGTSSHEGHEAPGDFFSFRLSIIFPVETGRFANRKFHKLAEETVYLNCPAHIYPEMLWLERERMSRFETLHKSWLEAKRDDRVSSEIINATAGELILFLLKIREGRNG